MKHYLLSAAASALLIALPHIAFAANDAPAIAVGEPHPSAPHNAGERRAKWESLTPEQQAERRAKREERKAKWEAMSPEDKAAKKAKWEERKAKWNALSPEEKAAKKAERAERKAKWATMTPEEKTAARTKWKAEHPRAGTAGATAPIAAPAQ